MPQQEPTKTVLITGGNGGIGLQCARSLLQSGCWHVVIAARPGEKTANALRLLQQETPPNARVTALPIDLASLQNVRELAARVIALPGPPLHAIICNAGFQSFNEVIYSPDGIELTFAVNHLAHFLLTQLLLPHLSEPGRIIMVASSTHDPRRSEGRFNPPRYESARALAYPEKFARARLTGIQRYATSKLCAVLHAYELTRRLQAQGRRISVFASDPGAVLETGIARDFPPLFRKLIMNPPMLWLMGVPVSSTETSGQAMARLVLDPALEGVTGKYYLIHRETHSSRESHDREKALELWQSSLALTGLTDEGSL